MTNQQAPSATVDADALFDKYSIGDTGNTQDILTKELFVKALTEALRGSYSKIGDNK